MTRGPELAIELPDGRLIRDESWHTVADVMAAAHGQGVRRMPGRLVQLDDQGRPAPRWDGPTCVMCSGTGEHFAYRDRGDGTVARNVPTGLPCAACNGHGRDPS